VAVGAAARSIAVSRTTTPTRRASIGLPQDLEL